MRMKNMFTKAIAIVLATIVTTVCIPANTVQAATYSIPSSAKTYKGHCYKVYYVKESITWDKAEQYCESKGGHLVTITSAGEATFVEKIANATHKNALFWIGGISKNKQWTWVTGEKMTYKAPLKAGSQSSERGLLLTTYNDTWITYGPASASKQSYYICEWDTSTATVLPEQVALSGVKKVTSTSVVVSWKKVSDAKGYAVYMKTGKNGTYKKVKTITNKNTTAFYQTKLKKGQTYYFRVRAYKDIYGEKSYGDLSVEKKITLK